MFSVQACVGIELASITDIRICLHLTTTDYLKTFKHEHYNMSSPHSVSVALHGVRG